MVDNCRRYVVEYEVLVFGLYDIVYTISDWNFGSTGEKDSKSYRR
jgi:hypothetical protein